MGLSSSNTLVELRTTVVGVRIISAIPAVITHRVESLTLSISTGAEELAPIIIIGIIAHHKTLFLDLEDTAHGLAENIIAHGLVDADTADIVGNRNPIAGRTLENNRSAIRIVDTDKVRGLARPIPNRIPCAIRSIRTNDIAVRAQEAPNAAVIVPTDLLEDAVIISII